MPKYKTVTLIAFGLIGAVALRAIALSGESREAPHARPTAFAADEGWQAVAPGRVEPRSGEIRIASPMMARISAVLVKPDDKVFAGEALMNFDDTEARARVASARAQIAVRKRMRNEQSVTGRAADRRKAEDAVADAEDAATAAAINVDKTAIARRQGTASGIDFETSRKALAQAQKRLAQSRDDLRAIEAEPATPLPGQLEGQLQIARTELRAAEAGLERLVIRSPIDGTVLQANAKPGEFGAQGSMQPLISLGDISALRVRAEVDERDYTALKIGQPVVVRCDAFRGRDFTGTVASIAPFLQPGRLGGLGPRNLTDVNVAEVVIDLAEPGPLAVGMKADVYFGRPSTAISKK